MINWDLAVCSHSLRANVSSTFLKVVLHAQWRSPRRRYGISFWELFLCASGFKEKVDKKEVVAIVSGTVFRYQNLLDAFSFEEVAPKKKLCKKKRAFLRSRRAGARF